MKKWLLGIGALTLSFSLAACGGKSNSDASTTTKESTKETSSETKTEKTKVDVADKVFYKWNDESTGGSPKVSSYAVIKNTGDTTVDVSNTKITYLNDKGEALRVTQANSMYRNLAPSVIKSGEVAYLGIDEDATDDISGLKDIKVEVSPSAFETGVNELKASKTKVLKTDDWGGSISVTGSLKNDSDKEATDIQSTAGLYDKNNKFLGALFLSSDDQTVIKPKQETSIDMSVPSLPTEKVKEVDHADLKANVPNY
ncbi:hypothetical protein P8917_01210 [Bacillus atrophaeus]|uniref:LptM family lipoprotein n=1 Tax=Bacillus atrophaeus TaxID=1452 RepID=UPI0022809F33|nr:hypothetical protein [Bacillus atrophaeus]MCY8813620.1 hypothetical protein [Bacillus atrophaeus]MCY8820307.1 hypothetical protein [Bacillus atrophaeus]MCY8828569.1 hypothetical protein [Bacillus atrophaeus]MCY8832656.1 hypothetical protein [Bacillus atrophaeus]MEC0749810.1 hypothetical protein [Bacillus atrophaeus]